MDKDVSVPCERNTEVCGKGAFTASSFRLWVLVFLRGGLIYEAV